MRKLITVILIFLLPVLFIQAVFRTEDKSSSEEVVDLFEFTPWYTNLFDSLNLSKAALYNAYSNFQKLSKKDELSNDSLLAIIDFSKASNQKRFYILDIKNKKLLYHLLVAHGQGSGELFAKRFSNRPQSHMSSLGVFRTSNTYSGKHGYSLRLDGLEKGLNDRARARAIVIHGANYVSEKYVESIGRLGRSFGCPALPMEVTNEVIDLIKEGTCLYIYHPSLSN